MSDETNRPDNASGSRPNDGQETVFDGSIAPMSLGASATYAAGKKGKGKGRGDGDDVDGDGDGEKRRRLPRIRPGLTAAIVFAFIILFAFVPLVSSSLQKTPKDRVGISYGGGPIEGAHFQKIVMPGSSLFFNGWFDSLYLYPADQQNYIVSGPAAGADAGQTKGGDASAAGNATSGSASTVTGQPVVAPSKDRVQVTYQAAVYYRLNIDELRSFHENFGLRYQAFTDSGWRNLIQDTLRQQLEAALLEETRRYAVSDIYGDVDVLLKIQTAVQDTLSDRLGDAMGGQYFCAPTYERGGECGNPTFVVKSVDVPERVRVAFEENKRATIGIDTRTSEAEQRRIEAEGVKVLNEALGANGNVYALLRAIESGKINFWVVPEGNGLNLGAPGTDGGTETPATPGADAGTTAGG